MEINETLFIAGFNNGYLMAQYEPALIKKISAVNDNTNDYLRGLIFGKEEYRMEKLFGKGRNKPRIDAPDKDLDKDIEKER